MVCVFRIHNSDWRSATAGEYSEPSQGSLPYDTPVPRSHSKSWFRPLSDLTDVYRIYRTPSTIIVCQSQQEETETSIWIEWVTFFNQSWPLKFNWIFDRVFTPELLLLILGMHYRLFVIGSRSMVPHSRSKRKLSWWVCRVTPTLTADSWALDYRSQISTSPRKSNSRKRDDELCLYHFNCCSCIGYLVY